LQGPLHGLFGDDDDLLGVSLEPRKGGLYRLQSRLLQIVSA
jgi:hypothetical protein